MTQPSIYSASIARYLGLDDYQYFLAELPDSLICGELPAIQDTIYRNAYIALTAGATLEGVLAEIEKAVTLAQHIAARVTENAPAPEMAAA